MVAIPFWSKIDHTIISLAQIAFEMANDRRELKYLAARVGRHVKDSYPNNPSKEALLADLRKLYSHYWRDLPATENDGDTTPNAAVLTGFNPKA